MAMVSPAQAKPFDFSKPPFWMMTFEEYEPLRASQKKFYQEGLVTEAKALRGLSSLTLQDVQDAAVWSEPWEDLMKKVYEACADKKNQKICEKIADVRLKTFAAGSSEATTDESKSPSQSEK